MTSPADHRKPRLRSAAKLLFHALIAILVAWGIWRTVEKARLDLRREQSELTQELELLEAELLARGSEAGADAVAIAELETRRRVLLRQRFSLWQINPVWLVLSGLLYLAGCLPSWIFWHRVMEAMGQQPRWLHSLRAYFIGHLGKYVPGKAMVVVLRTGLVRSQRVDTTVAAASVFVETLTLMAVGALISAAILAALFRDQGELVLWSLLLMVAAGVPTLPPIFRRLVRLLKVRRASPDIDRALAGLSFRLMGFGWLAMAAGWLLMGLSLWAVMQSLPGEPRMVEGSWDVLRLTAAVALAVVLGFLSLIPGGFGVREAVVMTLLAEPYGGFVAIIAAVLLRLVWLLAEVFLSMILYVSPGPAMQPATVEQPASASSA